MTDAAQTDPDLGRRSFAGTPPRGRPRPPQPAPGRRPLITVLLLLAIAGSFAGIDFARFARQVAHLSPPADVSAEGIVALTGGTARIDGALALLRDNRAEKLLISGVNPAVGRHDIARAVERASSAVLDQRVDLGHAARDTIGNADETRDWVERKGIHSLIIVTSDYHMPRSMVELGRAMPGVRLIPYPVSNKQLEMDRWWRHGASVKLLLSEYLKYTLARARLAFETPRGESVAAFAADTHTHATTGGVLR
ncbi:YdcF family protein [Kaistia defluvii]|uniref:YdcF family protein n=1 Tax=Kaistia defluvii TaxID=410841 RepID=UPI0022518CC0|nr:YdcF family protein [Kaistia defluvii]MCX5518640.1 YdcF family protein [Kaistia defluvii]